MSTVYHPNTYNDEREQHMNWLREELIRTIEENKTLRERILKLEVRCIRLEARIQRMKRNA